MKLLKSNLSEKLIINKYLKKLNYKNAFENLQYFLKNLNLRIHSEKYIE